MMPRSEREQQILASWRLNASPWIQAIEGRQIETRRLVTDGAIVSAVQALAPRSVLDVGCGEGWLVRALSSLGYDVTGIDATQALIDQAVEQGVGHFKTVDYASLSSQTFSQQFDVAVCNFSLLGKRSVEHLLSVLSKVLHSRGHVVIQTLHPLTAGENYRYCDGWREGSWDGFGKQFSAPAPWYFRTIESWVALLQLNGFAVEALQEPVLPQTGRPCSIIIVGRAESKVSDSK